MRISVKTREGRDCELGFGGSPPLLLTEAAYYTRERCRDSEANQCGVKPEGIQGGIEKEKKRRKEETTNTKQTK